MPRIIVTALTAVALLLALAMPAAAQSGHFIESGRNAPECVDVGTTVECTFKVAGLGGTTFEVTVDAEGVAEVQCRNPGGNVAPGQDTTVEVSGTTGELSTPRNGQFSGSLSTTEPSVPNTPTCPNPQWTAEVVDVEFGDATLTLLEDDAVSDQITVAVE